MSFGRHNLYVDLGAERLIAAERGAERIAVEVKSFAGPSEIADLESRVSEKDYFAREHVIVSYNGDLRCIVEDIHQKQRRVRCSVSSFANIGAFVEGSSLLATVPAFVAEHIVQLRPRLRTASLPFGLGNAPMEILWPSAADDDEACRFLRETIARVARG